jgi:uncharacterized membrane protein AbrB (regulator of aidB expression)
MQAVAGIIGVIFGAVVVYLLVKNIGTQNKPTSALGQSVGGLTSIVSSLTNGK